MPPTVVTSTFPRTIAITPHETGPVHTSLTWRPLDAAAVTTTIRNGADRPVTWWISRDLLHAGLTRQVGDGDITIGPLLAEDDDGNVIEDPTHIEVALRSPAGIGGNLSLLYLAAALQQFLDRTHQQVPAGAEYYEWSHTDLFRRETA